MGVVSGLQLECGYCSRTATVTTKKATEEAYLRVATKRGRRLIEEIQYTVL